MKPAKPTRMKASDFHPYILEIFDGYVHGKMTKREFLREAGKFAAAGVTGLMILNQLQPDYALAQQVKVDDPAIITSRVTVPSPDGHGSINGLLAKPAKAKGKLPTVLVIHENRGLNPYIEDVVRRLAKAGYMALGPDGLSSVGGYPGNDETGRALQAKLNPAKLLEDFLPALNICGIIPKARARWARLGFAMAAACAMRWRWPIPKWRHRCLIMVASHARKTCQPLKRRCLSIMPRWMNGSTQVGYPIRLRSSQTKNVFRCISTPERSMAFTMTARRVLTQRRQNCLVHAR
jgi:hypothetical protein